MSGYAGYAWVYQGVVQLTRVHQGMVKGMYQGAMQVCQGMSGYVRVYLGVLGCGAEYSMYQGMVKGACSLPEYTKVW